MRGIFCLNLDNFLYKTIYLIVLPIIDISIYIYIVLNRIVVCSWTPASKEKNAIPGEIMSFAFDVIGRNLALMKKVMAIRSPVIFTLRWQTIYTWQLVYATDLTDVTHSDFSSHIGNTALQLNVVHMMLILSLSNTIL